MSLYKQREGWGRKSPWPGPGGGWGRGARASRAAGSGVRGAAGDCRADKKPNGTASH